MTELTQTPPPAPKRFAPALKMAVAVLRWLGPDPAQPVLTPRQRLERLGRFLLPGGNLPTPTAPAAGGSGRLHTLVETYPLPTWRPVGRLVMIAIALFIVWANIARLDEVAIADGEVVPEGKVKVIQHLEGGVIREIYVSEGDEVKEGAPLLQLDLSAVSMNREELQVRLDGLSLQVARLQAELSGATSLKFPAEESSRQPALVQAEQRNFDARRQSHKSNMAVLGDQARQKALEVQELEARHRAIGANLKLARQRLAMSTDLVKSGLTAKMEHVQLQAQTEDLEGQFDTVRASIPRAQAAQAEAKSRLEQEQANYVRTTQAELSDAELNLARTRELLTQASDQQQRTQITSPTDGIIKNLRANTIGGVIRPGDPIMEIVPLHERLQIEAKLSPMDRGYVLPGQAVTVKLSAYDYVIYGGLAGTVSLVAPDTTIGPDNLPFYRVLVHTDKAYLGNEADKRTITPGMVASVEIHTGDRSVMQYLLKPVMKLKHEAFRER
ncbi:HlyD family type I secretion periplasmic adaptor subunit [Magnetospirillum sulfuroxidans]|uniref:Membrane fusion protein (MFP) family protein n=1 Tax=Magnetospirillum sulfuroxidans TaxID=611300 RepID=A0ABS5IB80_9PROT|nr:HlyD family type I secretion periplasmic adaptor subunit [Magnetospirillum sulfuroxidans]MBR9971684.1 HlyD family type I secretion periplasmic adaptor subunit [Magnetospirillum sulfuroxidans]